MLNKNSRLPLYVQLENILRSKILEGNYKEGDAIPSEIQLAEKYGITRTTVRKSIANLVNEGILTQIHGKGTFVCLKEVKYNMWNFGGFTDYIVKRGEVPCSKVLKKEILKEEGEEYLLLQRARGVKRGNKEKFLTIDTSKIPLKIFRNIDKYDFADASLYNVMRTKYNVFPKRAEISICSIMSDEKLNGVFSLDRDTPLLKATGYVYDRNNNNIEKVSVIYGTNIEFKIVANMEI